MSKLSSSPSSSSRRLDQLLLLPLLLLLLLSCETIRGQTCEDCPANWYDIAGPEFGCQWYVDYDACDFADGFENMGLNAQEACCDCGGGVTDRPCDTPNFPTPQPTTAPPVSSDCEECPPGWYDFDGEEYNCEWYAANDFCASGAAYANFGVDASEACCECGASTPVGTCTSTIFDTPAPTPLPPPTLSPAPTVYVECVDCENWYDQDGPYYNCAWYEAEDYCDAAEYYANFGYSAIEACCYCGGTETSTCDIAPTTFVDDYYYYDDYYYDDYYYDDYYYDDYVIPEGCVDDPADWHDADGPDYNCQWYEDNYYCNFAEYYPDANGVDATMACCACGGGNIPPTASLSGNYQMVPTNVKNSGFERDEPHLWEVTHGTPSRECGGQDSLFGGCYFHFHGGMGDQRIEQIITSVGSGNTNDIFNLMFYARGVDLPGKKFFKGYIKTHTGSTSHSYPCRSKRDGTFDFRMMKCTFVIEEDFDHLAIIFKYMGDSGDVYLDKVMLDRSNPFL